MSALFPSRRISSLQAPMLHVPDRQHDPHRLCSGDKEPLSFFGVVPATAVKRELRTPREDMQISGTCRAWSKIVRNRNL
jgi:hypothetical protein